MVAGNSAPCASCPSCLAGRPNLCEDLLFVNGAYGEFIALPPRLVARNVVPLAASLPAERAAFAEPLACALLAIERARVEAGQTVVVFGHGPLGCLLGMLAASRGARVVMIGKAGWRFDRLKTLGFARWLDATAGNVVEAVRDATDRPGRRAHGRRDRPTRGLGAGRRRGGARWQRAVLRRLRAGHHDPTGHAANALRGADACSAPFTTRRR